NRATAWYAIVATARCSRWPRSSAMSIASEKKRQWSAPVWSQAQLSRERPANPGCHTPTLLDLVEERSTRFRAFHLTIVPHGLVFVISERHGDAAAEKQRRVENERRYPPEVGSGPPHPGPGDAGGHASGCGHCPRGGPAVQRA